jgi:quercetin dioxygenase-like cupin family protein
MPPGSATEEMLIGAGQKAGYVMGGTVELTVGEHSVLLEEGDSFQFSSDVDHGLANRSDQEAKVLWIISALDPRL